MYGWHQSKEDSKDWERPSWTDSMSFGDFFCVLDDHLVEFLKIPGRPNQKTIHIWCESWLNLNILNPPSGPSKGLQSAADGLPGLPTAQKTVAVVSQLWRRKVHGIAMHHHRAWLTDWALTGQGVSRIGNTMAVAQVAQVAQAKRHCNRISHLAKYSQKTCRMVLHTDYVPSTTKPEVQAGCINNCIIQ